jgi:intracellular sulfur oxidation DsrE/DsrF family protein
VGDDTAVEIAISAIISRQPPQIAKEMRMNAAKQTPRRGFLGRVFGAAAAAVSLPLAGTRSASAQESSEDWLKDVKGAHRCLFDFPQMNNGMPLLHILNYLNTYREAYKAAPGTVGAVGTFYSIGPRASIPFAFNDAMWKKYELGAYTGLKDAAGTPYTRNPFWTPTKNELHLMMAVVNSPTIPAFGEMLPALGIQSLQQMGTKFLLCNNAFGGWCLELEARGKGKMADLQKDLSANLLPGVTAIPAMVIAIEQAQAAGIRYNRQ